MSADLNGQLDGSMRRWRRYPAYSAPGSQWLAELPSHWRLKRLKHVATIQTGLTLGKDYAGRQTVICPYLRVANVQDGYLDLDTITQVSVPAEDVERHELRTGDVLMTEGGDFDKLGRGYVWDGQIEGCLHQNHIFAVRPNRQVLEPHFLAALMTSAHGKNYFTTTSQQTTNLASTNSTKLKNFPLPLPCAEEQRLILGFLGRETAKIDALLAKKERLIELLQEKRTALISHAVTRGLDPSVEMKDSGVAWLGQIPAHWGRAKFRHYVDIAEGQVNPTDEQHRTAILVAPNHVESGTGRLLYTETAFEQGAISGKYPYKVGDVVYSKIRPELRKACIPPQPGLCSADMYPLTPRTRLKPKFLLYLLLSEYFTQFTVVTSERVAMPKINRGDLGECYLLLPPLEEQDQIVSRIEAEAQRLDALIAKVRQGIERLREYRTALISAAVTGKIDVREEGP